MKALLMYRDRDFDARAEPPAAAADLVRDLDLAALFAAMGAGDAFVSDVAERAVLRSLPEPAAIAYRQGVLADCLARADVVRALYDLAIEGIQAEKGVFFGVFGRSPETVLYRAVRLLEALIPILRRLRGIAEAAGGGFRSDGFTRLFATLRAELDEPYLQVLEEHLRAMRFPDGVLMSAALGPGNKGTHYVLRQPARAGGGLMERLFGRHGDDGFTFEVADRDEAGLQALSELRARGINGVANALAQSADHILGFFGMLRAELGFYIGCLNLHDALAALGEPTCTPEAMALNPARLAAHGLYDPCLALRQGRAVVGNHVEADGKPLLVVTGANQGGKSTFLRSLGVAQLMLQCGMFAPAERMAASVCAGLFSHFKREEDPSMRHGKLDEELARMSGLVDHMLPGAMLLSNESFASTNEREGSEIARQIVRALLDCGVRVALVTHLFDLAQGLHEQAGAQSLFLRAEREPDGRRTFRVVPGAPLPTSYGRDLYERIFGPAPASPEQRP